MNNKLFYPDKSIFERFVKELCKKYYGNLEYVSLTPNREFFELVLNVCRELNLTPEKVINYGIKYLYSDKESIMNIILEHLNNVKKFGLFENFKEIGRLSLEELSKFIYSIFINAFRDFREENYVIKIENLSKAYEDFITLYERLKDEEEFKEIF